MPWKWGQDPDWVAHVPDRDLDGNPRRINKDLTTGEQIEVGLCDALLTPETGQGCEPKLHQQCERCFVLSEARSSGLHPQQIRPAIRRRGELHTFGTEPRASRRRPPVRSATPK